MKLLQRRLEIYDSFFHSGPARRILLWSRWARDYYIDEGTDGSLLSVVSPGLFVPELRSRQADDQLKLLFVGNDFVRKGGIALLQAFSDLRARFGHKVTLTIISNYTWSKAIPYGVAWLRSVSHLEIDNVYQEHSLFVLPAYAEGFGMCVLEAMSHGLPAVVTNIAALPEIVSDGVTGFTCPIGNIETLTTALERLVCDDDLRAHMSRAARERVATHFSPPVVGAQLRQVYDEAVHY